MLSIQTHTCTHTHGHTPPPCPPLSFLRFSSFVGLSFRLFIWFLKFVSLPQSRAKYSPFSTPIFLSCPFSAALSVFLSFFSKALWVAYLGFMPERRKAAECVCHTLYLRVFLVLFQQGATGSLHSCRQRSSMQMTRTQGLIIPMNS